MAKPIKAATTRISATVTARYNPAAGATDAFYLDGRMNSRREMRAADITLDREDRGFFYAAFAHAGANNADEGVAARARQALDNMLYNMKQTGRNIDSEINELADTAVEVAGRITLQHDNVRQPYFAGVIVRDSELAAITMGGGCAYLYRNNILYPLTTDDYPLEPIDQDGNPVDRLNIYCAGVAGTVRYSNIAQLAVDDCLIVCNLELMEAIGQHEILRLLDEAEDQCEAAGMVITAAAAKQPNTSMQFLIGFVEEISAAERVTRSGGRTGFGSTVAGGFGSFGSGGNRPQTASYEPPVNKAPAVESADSTSTDAVDFSAAASSHIKPEPFASAFASKPDDQNTSDFAQTTGGFDYNRLQEPAYNQSSQADQGSDPFSEDVYYNDDFRETGRGKRVAFYALLALIAIASLFAIYSMLFKKDDPGSTVNTTSNTTVATTSSNSTTAASSTGTTDGTSMTSGTTTASTQVGGLPAKHTVVSGDTFYSIAKKYYNESTPELWKLIKDANNMTSDNLQVGQVLTIPVR
jgi:LysM repeat protein